MFSSNTISLIWECLVDILWCSQPTQLSIMKIHSLKFLGWFPPQSIGAFESIFRRGGFDVLLYLLISKGGIPLDSYFFTGGGKSSSHSMSTLPRSIWPPCILREPNSKFLVSTLSFQGFSFSCHSVIAAKDDCEFGSKALDSFYLGFPGGTNPIMSFLI